MFQLSGFYCNKDRAMLVPDARISKGGPRRLIVAVEGFTTFLRLMDKILHYLKDPKLWELWYIPYYGSCRILSINRMLVQFWPKGY